MAQTKITLTERQAEDLVYAQLTHTHDTLAKERYTFTDHETGEVRTVYSTCDDGGDYLSSALDLAAAMHDTMFQQGVDVEALNGWLAVPPGGTVPEHAYRHGFHAGPHDYASDGVCEEILALIGDPDDGEV